MSDQRVLTVRQPWAWAIAIGAKNVENRTRGTNYRGLIWIHAAQSRSNRGQNDQRVKDVALAFDHEFGSRYHYAVKHLVAYSGRPPHPFVASMIIASAELADCHPADGCCEPWGEDEYVQADGRRRTDIWHWVFEDAVELSQSIPAKGRLGLWRPDPDLAEELERAA